MGVSDSLIHAQKIYAVNPLRAITWPAPCAYLRSNPRTRSRNTLAAGEKA